MRWVLWILAVSLVAASLAAAAGPNDGVIDVEIRGLPPKTQRVWVAAHVVDPRDSTVVEAELLNPAGAQGRLGVEPGHYLVVGTAAGAGRTFRRISRIVHVKRRGRKRVRLKARAAQEEPPAVVAVDEIALVQGNRTYKLRGIATTMAFQALNSRGIKIVDDSPATTKAIKTEEKLSRDGRTEWKFRSNPLRPTVRLGGSGTLKGGRLNMQLKLVRQDGTIAAIKSFSTKAKKAGDIGDFVRDSVSTFTQESGEQIEETATSTSDLTRVNASARIEGYSGLPHGTLTVTPPGVTYSDESVDHRAIDSERLPIGSKIRYEAVVDDPSKTYFFGWGSSACGYEPVETKEPVFECTVEDQGPYKAYNAYAIAEFNNCPEPGSYVAGDSNARTCPGVHVVPPPDYSRTSAAKPAARA